jgi:hypothetical protein
MVIKRVKKPDAVSTPGSHYMGTTIELL